MASRTEGKEDNSFLIVEARKKAMSGERPVVGVISIADSRKDVQSAIESREYVNKNHSELIHFLEEQGIEVVDPGREMAKGIGKDCYAVTATEHLDFCIRTLRKKEIQCLIIGCWQWSQPMLAVDLVRRLDVPTALFTRNNPDWTGVGCVAAVGASLWEVAPNRSAITHLRVREDKEKLVSWIRGVSAYRRLAQKNLLLWGGSYCLGMDHLQDDIARLKSFLIRDVLNEGEYFLIKRAEEILERGEEIKRFLDWLQSNGTQIVYDTKMLTPQALARQVALYLAAETRLEELEGENIAGVSVLCHPELSVEYGVTACFIPAFLPFGENHCGPKKAIPTTCEGDIKSLLTCVLLSQLVPDAPPLFGDLRDMIVNGKAYIAIANCGGASVYYAANSCKAREVLPKVTISGQCHGKSGGAVGYTGGGGGAVTVASLVRIKGRYWMQLGVGEALNVGEEAMAQRKWGRMWPHVVVDLGTDVDELLTICGSNHYSLVPGVHVQEATYACLEAGIPVIRVDLQQEIEKALSDIKKSLY